MGWEYFHARDIKHATRMDVGHPGLHHTAGGKHNMPDDTQGLAEVWYPAAMARAEKIV
jgi:hypothetical protein